MKLIIIIAMLGLAGCTHSLIVKECKAIPDDTRSVCRSILPWQ